MSARASRVAKATSGAHDIPSSRVAVATSGGRDSTALLHATRAAARVLGVEVVALHVHHGLMPEADGWQAHVERQCRRWHVPLEVIRLEGAPTPGDSVEAWARRARYAALASAAQGRGITLVLLAHHRRDQAETFLLQALRGAGPPGLASMPRIAQRGGVTWVRPWLDRPREAIEAYVRRHRLAHVDDPSNDDPRFARSRLRATVWPALQLAFPDAESTLGAAASRAAEAAFALAELAALDETGATDKGALSIPRWLALSPARRSNLLRAWLAKALPGPAPETLVRRLVDELPLARAARWPAGDAELRLYRGRLLVAPTPSPGARTPPELRGERAAPLALHRPGLHRVPGWSGWLRVESGRSGGASAELLRAVAAAPRQGGERFRLTPRGQARSLKKQYQARGVPSWQRKGPLLYTADGRLLFVPGLGVDASLQSPAGSSQLILTWEPAPMDATGAPEASEATGDRQAAD